MKLILSMLVFVFCFLACSELNKGQHNQQKQSNDQEIKNAVVPDTSSVLLKIERGAFHYDQFVLRDTILTFYPSSDHFESNDYKYIGISKKTISKEKRNNLVRYLVDNGILDLKPVYSNDASCNSELIVTFIFNGQTKKIICNDFKMNCPDLLQYLEEEMIRLHGKNLKRVLLPG
ncbi:hypothetical protein ABW636_02965 [Aquimarina sp. 2201CG1-2-11]|uniref:hypothetical protein n=1 Tax=Aquimarina discodermiae TaxID=3231043 RepID=UPI003462FC1F